uniref:Cytochrome c oxidase assembly protein COX11, mitochondrial n=1 Tax=Hanseniaspora osmophila TaxID=56408 RepID=A0A1E5R7Z5_9ASCO
MLKTFTLFETSLPLRSPMLCRVRSLYTKSNSPLHLPNFRTTSHTQRNIPLCFAYSARRKFTNVCPLRSETTPPTSEPSKTEKEAEIQRILSTLSSKELAELRRMKHEKENAYKDKSMTYYFSSIILVFLGLAYAAVPLYRAICARTGFGGIPITDKRKFTNDKLVPVASEKRLRIRFSSEVSNILPWTFTPEQKEVFVLPGETALAFYKAKNTSDKDIIGMATYSITPGEAAQYFNKIQCFCFEEQKLNAGEEIDMPVFFFIDPEFANDPAMKNIDDIILHYCFFKAHYSDGSAVSDGVLEVVDAKNHDE